MPPGKLRGAGRTGSGAQDLQEDERRKVCTGRKDYRLFFLIRSGNRGPVRPTRSRSMSTS